MKLKLLNFVHIKRGGRGRKLFRNIGHLLISGSSATFKMAYDPDVRGDDLPLAFSLSSITNRLWLSLHKNIVDASELPSANIINRSIIILDREGRKALAEDYHNFIRDLQNGKIKKEDVLNRLMQYQDVPHSTDDINDEDKANGLLDFINNTSLEEYIEERDAKAIEAKQNKEISQKAIHLLWEERKKEALDNYVNLVKGYKKRRRIYFKNLWTRVILRSFIIIILYVTFLIIVAYIGILDVVGINDNTKCSLFGKIITYIAIAFIACFPFIPNIKISKKIHFNIKLVFPGKERFIVIKKILKKFKETNL